MKTCRKPPEPPSLASYRAARPSSTWDDTRSDPFHGGQQSYQDVKRALIRSQRCLCAYCEIRIADGTDDAALDARKHEQRVEHFHPKGDQSGSVNWALHWPNLWAVCHGGSSWPGVGVPLDPKRYLPPLPANLSCDAFKDRQIAEGKLPQDLEGWILAPDEVPAFPLLFQFAPNGTPEAHPGNCAAFSVPNNHHSDTATLVAKTIEHLNLGCPRLNRNHCIAKAQLEKLIAGARKGARGASSQDVMLDVARRLFSRNIDTPWPEFFTLVRWRLGEPAENHLRSIQYTG